MRPDGASSRTTLSQMEFAQLFLSGGRPAKLTVGDASSRLVAFRCFRGIRPLLVSHADDPELWMAYLAPTHADLPCCCCIFGASDAQALACPRRVITGGVFSR